MIILHNISKIDEIKRMNFESKIKIAEPKKSLETQEVATLSGNEFKADVRRSISGFFHAHKKLLFIFL